jgi:hypothetical protein
VEVVLGERERRRHKDEDARHKPRGDLENYAAQLSLTASEDIHYTPRIQAVPEIEGRTEN